MDELPQNLKIKLSHFIYEKTYEDIPFLQNKTNVFLCWVYPLIKSYLASEKEYVYFEGDEISCIYFLKKGECGFVLPRHNDSKYIDIDVGQEFGIHDIIASIL